MSDLYQTQGYEIPTNSHTSLASKLRPKSVSKCFFSNQSNSNSQDSGKKVPTVGPSNSGSSVPQRHKMAEDDMKLPIFNGNGLEDAEQHWFLCDAVWTVRQV